MHFECSTCGLARLYKVEKPHAIIIDMNRDYYNSIHPNVIAVLDNKGYEIPKKYWSLDSMGLPVHESGLECLQILSNGKGPYPKVYGNIQVYLPCYPPRPKMKTITAQTGGMQVNWNGSSNYQDNVVSGFQLEYATNADFKDGQDRV